VAPPKRMNRSYRIQRRGEEYLVIDDSEETLGVYGNRKDAKIELKNQDRRYPKREQR
jgi:hypothetical protein